MRCNDECEQNDIVAGLAEDVPDDLVTKQVWQIHHGPCPKCGGNGPVDLHTSYRVWSALILTSSRSRAHIVCRPCGSKGARRRCRILRGVWLVGLSVGCISTLRAGPIKSLGGADLIHDGPLALSLGKRQYLIRVESSREDLFDAKVVRPREGKCSTPRMASAMALPTLSNGPVTSMVMASISSKASASQLVGEAAIFETGD